MHDRNHWRYVAALEAVLALGRQRHFKLLGFCYGSASPNCVDGVVVDWWLSGWPPRSPRTWEAQTTWAAMVCRPTEGRPICESGIQRHLSRNFFVEQHISNSEFALRELITNLEF